MKTVIEMAREVQATAYTNRHYPDRTTYTFGPEQLEAFAELVRADERARMAEQPAQQEQHMSGLTKVEEAIIGYWGERCSTFESECPVCQAWVEFEIKTALGPNCYPPLKPLPKEKL